MAAQEATAMYPGEISLCAWLTNARAKPLCATLNNDYSIQW